MPKYPVHTLESAPEKSRPALQDLKQTLGFIPNLAAAMAESPPLVQSFVGTFHNFHHGTLTPAQRQVLLLSNAVANRCSWAVAFHSAIALKEGVDADEVRAIRDRRLPKDAKLRALSTLTRALIEKRGHLDDHDLGAFADAGFRPDQVLEVIAGVAASAMANYAGNVAQPPVEAPFAAHSWSS